MDWKGSSFRLFSPSLTRSETSLFAPCFTASMKAKEARDRHPWNLFQNPRVCPFSRRSLDRSFETVQTNREEIYVRFTRRESTADLVGQNSILGSDSRNLDPRETIPSKASRVVSSLASSSSAEEKMVIPVGVRVRL